jgi:hypothetical protein
MFQREQFQWWYAAQSLRGQGHLVLPEPADVFSSTLQG